MHLWHVKRFKMIKKLGYYLKLGFFWQVSINEPSHTFMCLKNNEFDRMLDLSLIEVYVSDKLPIVGIHHH